MSGAEVKEIAATPEAAVALLDDDADSEYPLEDVRLPGCLGLFLRMTPIKIQQVAQRPEREIPAAAVIDPDRFEIEKVWDVINYLLTGTATDGDLPASFLVNGGTELDVEDDDTHLRLLTPQQVDEIDQYLQSLTLDDLRARVDVGDMVKARVLTKPKGNDGSGKQAEFVNGVLKELEQLKTFIAGTREKSNGLVVMLS
ncbi:MAG TPA: DUF1877 family protein [Gemmatimonadaceae bacterium]|nr:DUF1877 family protein [Gemmatimonadaceae bacterium]